MDLDFEKMGGLIPAIIQNAESGKVLMLAYMDTKAWEKTLETKKTWFYSRSRKKYWMKGEESGNVQHVKEAFFLETTDLCSNIYVAVIRQMSQFFYLAF